MFEKLYNLEIIPDKSDFVGKKFSHLTVIARGPNYVSPKGHKTSQWWCQCDCEQKKIILVRRNNLTNGNTKSCGCENDSKRKQNLKKAHDINTLDLTNQIFGELIALNPTTFRNNGSVVWECKCSCGKIHNVSAHDLKHKRIESCGHLNESKGVKKIKAILENNKIPYEIEKTFDTCRFLDTNKKARFDFYINNAFLLEFDGIQHFKECDLNFFTDTLIKRQEHDRFKNQWCKLNKIPLKRIPYTDLDKINLESIMGDQYLI